MPDATVCVVLVGDGGKDEAGGGRGKGKGRGGEDELDSAIIVGTPRSAWNDCR
jgi:hypothetical protein